MSLQLRKLTPNYAIGENTVTGESGTLTRRINGTGVSSVLGSVLSCSTTVDNQMILQSNEFDAVCFCAESGIPDGQLMWCWNIGSICKVLFKNGESSTRGYLALCADDDGRAYNIEVPTTNPLEGMHFKEIGHVRESVSSGVNVLVLIETHLN
jgi:hypothetical protein